MRRVRPPLLVLAAASLLTACQSAPRSTATLPRQSSLLAVDVLLPESFSRDTSLVNVFFAKGPVRAGMHELPEIVPATFVKWSRAYLLDPDPGSYSIVAVSSAFAPPFNVKPVAGIENTTWSGTSSDAMIFPEELIAQTTATVAPGHVVYMGMLRVRRGDRINAGAAFQDDLQMRIAERIRPGSTSQTGFKAWLKRTRMVDLRNTSISREFEDWELFFDETAKDLAGSPWARFVAQAAPGRSTGQVASEPVPEPLPAVVEPEPRREPAPVVAKSEPQPLEPAPVVAKSEPQPVEPPPVQVALVPTQPPAPPEPVAPTPRPPGRRFPGAPPGSQLAKVEYGMSHRDVQKLMGKPDRRRDRVTRKAFIPFYDGPDATLRDWIYKGEGRVVFSLYKGKLKVLDVVYDQ